jgi:DNA ligase-associated metallophosphoesterase
MDDGIVDIEVAGERLELMPHRALYWPAGRSLLVADVHAGRIETLRADGAPVPGDTLGATLQRLEGLVDRSAAETLFVLGDLVQGATGLTDRVVDQTCRALSSMDCETYVVPGNHDSIVGGLPAGWPVEMLEPAAHLGPFVLCHEPEPSDEGYVLAGHLHPTVLLEGGGDRLRLPCFAFGDDVGVLPAFHTMTNGVEMSPDEYRLFAIADDEVVALRD